MDCVICHGKEIEKTEIREEIKAGSDIVYVSMRSCYHANEIFTHQSRSWRNDYHTRKKRPDEWFCPEPVFHRCPRRSLR